MDLKLSPAASPVLSPEHLAAVRLRLEEALQHLPFIQLWRDLRDLLDSEAALRAELAEAKATLERLEHPDAVEEAGPSFFSHISEGRALFRCTSRLDAKLIALRAEVVAEGEKEP